MCIFRGNRPEADYDHTLYSQGMPGARRHGAASERISPTTSRDIARRYVDYLGTRALVDPNRKLERFSLSGIRPNEDVWLTPVASPR